MNRCKWCNINNPKYIDYHDNEWGKLKTVTQMIAIIFCFLDKFEFGQFIFRVSSDVVVNSAGIYMTTVQFAINIISTIMLIVSIIATIFSGMDYLKNGKDLLKD